MIDEEEIYQALFDRVSEVRWQRPGEPEGSRRFITMSRRVRMFSEVSANAQPACFQAEHTSTEDKITGMPYKITLMATWIIYQSVGKDPKSIPSTENNYILKGVRKALEPRPTDIGFLDRRNTLGQLVHHCFISGTVFRDPGDLDGQGMLVVPIKLLIP